MAKTKNKTKVILASGSKARQDMLNNIGLDYEAIPSDVDEDIILKNLALPVMQKAQRLADLKAKTVSEKHKGALVIGSDQILELDGKVYSKAKNKDEARAKLLELRGRTHRLISAIAAAKDGEIVWQHISEAHLFIRDFDDEFLESYLDKAGDIITKAVGAYAIEEHGPWLFEKIEGDHFTILGMPLIPLLYFLRTYHGVSL